MIKLEKTITLKLENSKIVISDIKDMNNLLQLCYPNYDELKVDTMYELKEKINYLHQNLFGSELPTYPNEINILATSGILLKDHPLYKAKTILDLVNTQKPNIDFDIEISLTPEKLDYSCDDTPTPEKFENEQELEKFIEKTFFLNVIDGFAGTDGKSFMLMLITKYSMSKFIEFISSDDLGLDLYQRIEILENALLSA